MKLTKSFILTPLFIVVLLSGVALLGCGDDGNGTTPEEITLADFEGSWEATQYKVTNSAAPQIWLDLVALGGSFTMDADDAGNFTGQADIPATLGGPLTLQYQGSFQLVTQDTMEVTFNPEIPPFLTDFTGWFELSGNTLTLEDQNTTFDFDEDGQDEPAIFEGIMVRS